MKVLQLIFEDPAHHPVVRFSCQSFAEAGHKVWLLGRTPNPGTAIPRLDDFGPSTEVLTAGRGRTGWGGRWDFVKFVLAARRLVRGEKPDVVVCYDFRAAAAGYWATGGGRRARLVYHNLDVYAPSLLGRFVQHYEWEACRRAVCVTASSPGRAEWIRQHAGLAESPLVVKNCQRLRREEATAGGLSHILGQRGLRFDRLVVRLGWLGPRNAIEPTLRSVPAWEGNWGLVLGGMPWAGYLDELNRLVKELDIRRRVVILPLIPYDLWYDCLYAAHLGLALYEPHDLGNQTMAGAGNKLNLYLKAGIPSVIPDIPDFVEFTRRYDAGVVADPIDPGSIAAAVNAVFADERRYRELCSNARRAFEAEYNFETQYAPVLERVLGQAPRATGAGPGGSVSHSPRCGAVS
jgi:glycosyltransferase involved in cell wall biosynthesis